MNRLRALVIAPQLAEFVSIVHALRTHHNAQLVSEIDLPKGGLATTLHLKGEQRLIELDIVKPPRVGRSEAALATARFLAKDNPPTIVIVAGGAGGVGSELGSFVVADEIVDLATERKGSGGRAEFRAVSYKCDVQLSQEFALAVRENSEIVNIAPILSSDYVVASADFRDELLRAFPKIRAIEMEAGGVALALERATSDARLVVIRSIVDRSDEMKRVDSAEYAALSYQKLGRIVAAAVAQIIRLNLDRPGSHRG